MLTSCLQSACRSWCIIGSKHEDVFNQCLTTRSLDRLNDPSADWIGEARKTFLSQDCLNLKADSVRLVNMDVLSEVVCIYINFLLGAMTTAISTHVYYTPNTLNSQWVSSAIVRVNNWTLYIMYLHKELRGWPQTFFFPGICVTWEFHGSSIM